MYRFLTCRIVNCHKNKKKCSTGSTCTYCQKTERECVYPDTKPGRYQTGKNPTPKVQKRKYEVQQYQEEQYKLRLQQEEFMHQLNQYHQRLYQQQVFTPVITTLHDAVVIEDTPPPSPSPIVVEDTPPQSPELEMLEMLGSIPHKAPVVEDTALLDALVLEIPGLETQQPSTPPSKPSDPESPEAELLCQITPPDMELTVPINTSQIDSLFSLREPSPVPLASTPDSLFSMDPASPQSSISACTSLSSESPKPPSPKSGLTTPPAEAPPMEKLSLDQPPTPKSPALEPDKDIWDLSNIKMDTESPARELINELRDLPKINGCVNFDVQLSFDEVEELQAILVAGPTDFDFGSGGDNGFNWLDSGDLGLSGEADSPPSEDQGVKPQSFDEWKDFVFNEMATSTRTE